MKSNILLKTIIVSSLCLAALPGLAQKSGGASSGAGVSGAGVSGTVNAPGVSGNASVSTRSGTQQQLQGGQGLSAPGSADVNTSVSTGQENGQQQQNVQQNGQQQNGQQQNGQPQNGQFAATNASPNAATGPGTNNDGSQAGQPLTPTSRPAATNTVYATNSAAATNMSAGPQHDQAITEQDRAMLMQMRQAVFQGQPTAGWMNSIHFILKDGAVRIVGTVPSVAEKQRIEAIVTQIPGVVKVYDALAVNASAGADAGAVNASVNANGQGPVLPVPPTRGAGASTGPGVTNQAPQPK